MNHVHDCTQCQHLATIQNEEHGRTYDLYHCEVGPGPTVIARYGSEPGEYVSGIAAAKNGLYPLDEALRLAMHANLKTD